MALSDADLLRVFEAGEDAGLVAQATALVTTLRPDLHLDSLELGDRDRLIWAFKQSRFGQGTQMMAKVRCGSCSEWISFDLGLDFQIPQKRADSAVLQYGGREWTLRLPQHGDLAFVGTEGFPYPRLSLEAPWGDPEFRSAAEAAIDEADPGIDVVFDVSCADCGASTSSGFDAVSFVWRDIEALAKRLFTEVAMLARAFGWSESETLQMNPRRRARYVEMVS